MFGKGKAIAASLLGLLVALIILQLVLRLLKGVPVIGGLASDAQNLADHGAIS